MNREPSFVAGMIRCYRAERHRLLSNAVCSLLCQRRYGFSPEMRKTDQRQLAQLRANWQPYFAALAA